MSGTCEGCKHWHPLTDDFGTCELVKPMNQVSEGDATTPFLEDGGPLYTPRRFGCNLIEEKG